jgi:serine-type D-Ala-D-Ala carboxypeptidase/endopeptidase (penicillin-binding protein 4)
VVAAGAPTPVPVATARPRRRAPAPAVRRLDAGLARVLRRAGPNAGALVYDLTARESLFAARATVARAPASVEKLYTTVALLAKLGPGARLQTAVLGTGHMGPGGVWHGALYLRGGGDPTFGDGAFNQAWEDGYGPTASELAGQLTAHGIRRVTGRIIGDESLLDTRPGGPATGFAPDIPDFGGELGALTYDHGATSGSPTPGAFAAKELALVLRAAHVRVRAARSSGLTPPGARELAHVTSPPLSVLVKLMDVPSDDLFAELLTEQLGLRFGDGGTIAAGASVIAGQVSSLGVNPTITDGSGLSRADRSSPLDVVDLLRAVWQTPVGRLLAGSLPTVGVSGTVRGLALRTPAQGRCATKTGSLDNVTNLAGYCNSVGGHVLAFALFLDGPDNSKGFTLLGRMVAAIARY